MKYEDVYEFRNLLYAYRKARLGKQHRQEVLAFTYRLEENLIELQNELIHRTYRQGRYREFYVHEPKRRLIMALPFRDRVAQWALYAVIQPVIDQKFIRDSYACRPGFGAHGAKERLQTWMRQYSDQAYCLRMDVSKYFYRIDHNVLLDLYTRWIDDERILWLLEQIVRAGDGSVGIADGNLDYSERAPGVGMAVGNLVSQLSANVYLNALDQHVKHRMGVRHYMRYMDDMIVLSESKGYLHDVLAEVDTFLEDRLRLRLNDKTRIEPIRHGVEWVGYRVWPTHSKLRKSTARRMRRRLRALARRRDPGLAQSVASYEGLLAHCDAGGLRRSLEESLGISWGN